MTRPWMLQLARMIARRRLGWAFDGVWVHGLSQARELAASRPVLFCATHVGWWDGLLLLPVDEALGTEGAVLMDAAQLARLPFFASLGAVGLDRRVPATLRRGLRDAAARLDRPSRALWVFPQGRQRPPHLRPLGLQRGYRLLARLSGAAIVPVAITYAFREAAQPSALVSFEAPVADADLDAGLIAGLDRIDRFVDEGVGEFASLVPSRNARPDHGLATRMLAWWTRP